jgi:TPR repeat protein
MKAAVVGFVIGCALSTYLSALYLYSVWLPLTAICVILSGIVGSQYKQSFRPSAIIAGGCLLLYFSYFWIWPEVASSTASSPQSHFRAGELLKTRAQFFPDWPRALKHYQSAADADYPPALCAMAEFHYIGYMGMSKDFNLTFAMYERAANLGDARAASAVEYLSSVRKKESARDRDGGAATWSERE